MFGFWLLFLYVRILLMEKNFISIIISIVLKKLITYIYLAIWVLLAIHLSLCINLVFIWLFTGFPLLPQVLKKGPGNKVVYKILLYLEFSWEGSGKRSGEGLEKNIITPGVNPVFKKMSSCTLGFMILYILIVLKKYIVRFL